LGLAFGFRFWVKVFDLGFGFEFMFWVLVWCLGVGFRFRVLCHVTRTLHWSTCIILVTWPT